MIKSANVGTVDRMIRIVVGAALIFAPYIGIFETGALRWIVPIVGLVLVATALFRFCPLYRLIGASTCKV